MNKLAIIIAVFILMIPVVCAHRVTLKIGFQKSGTIYINGNNYTTGMSTTGNYLMWSANSSLILIPESQSLLRVIINNTITMQMTQKESSRFFIAHTLADNPLVDWKTRNTGEILENGINEPKQNTNSLLIRLWHPSIDILNTTQWGKGQKHMLLKNAGNKKLEVLK